MCPINNQMIKVNSYDGHCNGVVMIFFSGPPLLLSMGHQWFYCHIGLTMELPLSSAYLVFVFVFVIALVRSCLLITGGQYPPLGWVPFPLMVQPLNNRYHPPPGPALHTQSCNSITNHMRRTQNIRKIKLETKYMWRPQKMTS